MRFAGCNGICVLLFWRTCIITDDIFDQRKAVKISHCAYISTKSFIHMFILIVGNMFCLVILQALISFALVCAYALCCN